MRKLTMLSAAALTMVLAGSALADESDKGCTSSLDGRSIAAAEIRKGLEDVGYRVDRIKAEHGCYEVRAVNDSGFPIKALYEQATGNLLQAKLHRDSVGHD